MFCLLKLLSNLSSDITVEELIVSGENIVFLDLNLLATNNLVDFEKLVFQQTTIVVPD